MVALTENARKTLRRLLDKADTGADGLRIMVDMGGCSGMQYTLGLEKDTIEGDRVYEFEGVKVYVDPRSQPVVEGLKIDFVEDLETSGFVFDNPNARDVCSCGKSFAS